MKKFFVSPSTEELVDGKGIYTTASARIMYPFGFRL